MGWPNTEYPLADTDYGKRCFTCSAITSSNKDKYCCFCKSNGMTDAHEEAYIESDNWCGECDEGHLSYCNGRGRTYIKNALGDSTWMSKPCIKLEKVRKAMEI